MSPHAISSDVNGYHGESSEHTNGFGTNGANGSYAVQSVNSSNGSNGANGANGYHHETTPSFYNSRKAYLRATPKDELHDLVCVGFGPASLAIAIALQDTLEAQAKGASTTPGLQYGAPKVAFLEKQAGFAWHSGMLIEGAKMQISYVKDMATLRNPRSHYTFLNYLHNKNRIVQFSNLNTFLPQRKEFEDYLKWCANAFDDVVSYGEEVQEVQPNKSDDGKTIEYFTVRSRNIHTGQESTVRSKHVVVAVGGKPTIPSLFPRNPRIIHSSQYIKQVHDLLPDRSANYRLAVVGSGQSAAEIFDSLQSRYHNCRTDLIIRSSALKPSDDSPFVNEIFDPERTAKFFDEAPEVRNVINGNNKNTNYGVVRLELLEKIYETLYLQRLRYSDDEAPHHILTHRNVTKVDESENGKVYLGMEVLGADRSSSGSAQHAGGEYDLVVLATGYSHDAHWDILKNVVEDSSVGKWTVAKDYKLQLEGIKVAKEAGVWLQGCNEGTHGLSDTLLSVLAIRGGEIVQSIWGRDDAPLLVDSRSTTV